MNAARKTAPSAKAQEELAALKKAVTQALDRKKRLGQYAVVWKDDKPVTIGDDAPKDSRDNRQEG